MKNIAIPAGAQDVWLVDLILKQHTEKLEKNYIEVHHTKPLYSLEQETIVNPRTDLVCLCSNCHRMIHRKRDSILTLEELKEIIANNRIK